MVALKVVHQHVPTLQQAFMKIILQEEVVVVVVVVLVVVIVAGN